MAVEVKLPGASIASLTPLVGSERTKRLQEAAKKVRRLLSDNSVININSTASGGGVAEMIQVLLAYTCGAGINARWLVIDGSADFFALTKRIHNGLHGAVGDGGPLGSNEHAIYQEVLRANAGALKTLVKPGDFVILHDPQTAGLVPYMKEAGATVIWRCHIGNDKSEELTENCWNFLRSYLRTADAFVFTRTQYVPSWLDGSRTTIIRPSIDPFSSKNRDMSREVIESILGHAGLILKQAGGSPTFVRSDGSQGRLTNPVEIIRAGPPPHVRTPLVVQVSRWDRLKDMAGVMEAFCDHVTDRGGANLLLVGPSVRDVADDPEGQAVWLECIEKWKTLPRDTQHRIQLACLPMKDRDENAALVNAIQRHASVVLQKSIAEGFGLTVTEAMWKARPIVASATGGIPEQIVHNENGLLLEDPHDLEGCGQLITRLLDNPEFALRLGRRAKERVSRQFLADRHLTEYAHLLEAFYGTESARDGD